MILNIPETHNPGVYILTNKTNGKCYVGSASHIRRRVLRHKTDFQKGANNELMQQDYDSGHDFEVGFVEMIDSTRGERSRKEEELTLQYKSNEPDFGYNFYTAGKANGEKNANVSITEEKALRIIELINDGVRDCDIIRKLLINREVVRKIRVGETWKHLTGK